VFQIRVPIDDTHTQYWWYSTHPMEDDSEPEDPRAIPVYQVPVPTIGEDGTPPWHLVDNNSGQDAVMWYTQGPVADREQEHLSLSDQGVILFRKLMKESLERVERGEDPMNVYRDPARNVCLELPVERAKFGTGTFEPGKRRGGNASKYSVVLREAEAASKVPEPAAP
jgi:5,5'-dehydrodivanillate O-demethylase